MSYKIIAIEGIDRIGKSTFINALHEQIKDKWDNNYCRIEKPSIGLNTISKQEYPLMHIPSIFAIRNIGLFEELLFQVQQHLKNNWNDCCVIRDRFHLSELCYGYVLRKESYELFYHYPTPINKFRFQLYETWSHWFEQQLMNTGVDITLITFVVNEPYTPNIDEVKTLTCNKLKMINEEFRMQFEKSIIKDKVLIKLNMDSNGITDIMDYVGYVAAKINR